MKSASQLGLGVDIALVILNVLNIVFHTIGLVLLISVYRKGKKTVQQILLIYLSFSELVTSVPILVEELFGLATVNSSSEKIKEFETVENFINVAVDVLFCSYYASMIYITVDRLLGTVLNIRYPVYWNTERTKILLLVTNLLIGLGCVGATVAYRYTKYPHTAIFTLYVYSVLNIGFLVLLVVTYGYIFYRFTTRSVTTTQRESNNDATGLCGLCRKFFGSKFFLTFLLVLSFLLFLVIPNMYYWFTEMPNKFQDETKKDVIKIFKQISFLCDAVIYIFLNPSVRAELRSKLSNTCCRRTREPTSSGNAAGNFSETNI